MNKAERERERVRRFLSDKDTCSSMISEGRSSSMKFSVLALFHNPCEPPAVSLLFRPQQWIYKCQVSAIGSGTDKKSDPLAPRHSPPGIHCANGRC